MKTHILIILIKATLVSLASGQNHCEVTQWDLTPANLRNHGDLPPFQWGRAHTPWRWSFTVSSTGEVDITFRAEVRKENLTVFESNIQGWLLADVVVARFPDPVTDPEYAEVVWRGTGWGDLSENIFSSGVNFTNQQTATGVTATIGGGPFNEERTLTLTGLEPGEYWFYGHAGTYEPPMAQVRTSAVVEFISSFSEPPQPPTITGVDAPDALDLAITDASISIEVRSDAGAANVPPITDMQAQYRRVGDTSWSDLEDQMIQGPTPDNPNWTVRIEEEKSYTPNAFKTRKAALDSDAYQVRVKVSNGIDTGNPDGYTDWAVSNAFEVIDTRYAVFEILMSIQDRPEVPRSQQILDTWFEDPGTTKPVICRVNRYPEGAQRDIGWRNEGGGYRVGETGNVAQIHEIVSSGRNQPDFKESGLRSREWIWASGNILWEYARARYEVNVEVGPNFSAFASPQYFRDLLPYYENGSTGMYQTNPNGIREQQRLFYFVVTYDDPAWENINYSN